MVGPRCLDPQGTLFVAAAPAQERVVVGGPVPDFAGPRGQRAYSASAITQDSKEKSAHLTHAAGPPWSALPRGLLFTEKNR